MSRTNTDVIVTQYRAEFRAAPFARPRWEIASAWQTRETLPRRRRWTVARDFYMDAHPGAVSAPAYRHLSIRQLIDPDAVVVFVPDTATSRYGVAVLIEQKLRINQESRPVVDNVPTQG